MSSYLVYVPGEHADNESTLVAVGLGGIVDPFNPAKVAKVDAGPDGSAGLIFHWIDQDKPNANPIPDTASNDWAKAKPCEALKAGRFWLGKPKWDTITPASLERRSAIGGMRVLLDDQQEWSIPVARQSPHDYRLDDSAQPVRKPQARFEKFYNDTARFYELFRRYWETGVDLSLDEAWSFANEALSINYRVNADIVDWLELLGDESMPMLICATFEMAPALDDVKKNAPAGLGSAFALAATYEHSMRCPPAR